MSVKKEKLLLIAKKKLAEKSLTKNLSLKSLISQIFCADFARKVVTKNSTLKMCDFAPSQLQRMS